MSQIGATILITRPSTTFERILEPRKSDIDIEIIGNNLSGSIAAADSILSKLKSVDYLTDVGLEGEPTAHEIWLLVNKTAARSYGGRLTSITNRLWSMSGASSVFIRKAVPRESSVRSAVPPMIIPGLSNEDFRNLRYHDMNLP